jgi:hypothetical protein
MKESEDKEMKPTARLEGWIKDPVFNIIWGYIYGDTKGRFTDGTHIHTSDLMTSGPFFKGKVVRTLNSFYSLGEPFAKAKELV